MKQNLLQTNFLYRTWDGFSQVFRYIFRMDHQIRERELYSALQETAKRYPYFCVRVEREGEAYRFFHNDAPIPLRYGEDPVCLGSKEANGHYIAASFKDDSIYLDMYHNLSDGNGAVPWMKTILYLYLVKAVDPGLDAEGINLPGEAFLPNETEDPYEALEIPEDIKPFYTLKPVPVFVPDDRYREKPGRILYHVRADGREFIRLFRENDGTPAVLTTWLLKETIKRLFPDRSGLPIAASIPHQLRGELLGMNNYHDQVTTVMLRYDEKTDRLPMDRQMTAGRGSLFLQCDPDNMLCRIRDSIRFVSSVESMQTVEERRAAYRQASSLFIDNPETLCVTYPGNTQWGSPAEHIRDLWIYNSVLAVPLFVVVYPLNDSFCFTFQQRDNTGIYAAAFVSLLKENGIDAEITGCIDPKLCRVFIP